MDINELRAEVRRRQAAANAKVARLRRKGVYLAGTEFDVRRDPTKLSRYNKTQLNSYLGSLNSFVSRSNGFVPGAEGVPLRRSTWSEAQRVDNQLKQKQGMRYDRAKGVFIPKSGVDVDTFNTTMRRKNRSGPKDPMTFTPLQSEGVTSEAHLQRLTQANAKKLSKGHLPEQLNKQRYQMLEALKAYGDPKMTYEVEYVRRNRKGEVTSVEGEEIEVSLSDLAKTLTDEQLDILWNYTDAPRELFSDYHYLTALSEGKKDQGLANIHEDAADDAWEWLEWAAGISGKRGTNQRSKAKKK